VQRRDSSRRVVLGPDDEPSLHRILFSGTGDSTRQPIPRTVNAELVLILCSARAHAQCRELFQQRPVQPMYYSSLNSCTPGKIYPEHGTAHREAGHRQEMSMRQARVPTPQEPSAAVCGVNTLVCRSETRLAARRTRYEGPLALVAAMLLCGTQSPSCGEPRPSTTTRWMTWNGISLRFVMPRANDRRRRCVSALLPRPHR
jgi:hypothetical protein